MFYSQHRTLRDALITYYDPIRYGADESYLHTWLSKLMNIIICLFVYLFISVYL